MNKSEIISQWRGELEPIQGEWNGDHDGAHKDRADAAEHALWCLDQLEEDLKYLGL